MFFCVFCNILSFYVKYTTRAKGNYIYFALMHIYLLKGVILMDALISLIGNVGFPIAVSIYLLVRIEGKLESLTSSINNLSSTINTMDK